jgi:hypothetical protein
MFYGKSECFHASMKNFRLTNSRIGGKPEALSVGNEPDR